jgi:hypothetical protein
MRGDNPLKIEVTDSGAHKPTLQLACTYRLVEVLDDICLGDAAEIAEPALAAAR